MTVHESISHRTIKVSHSRRVVSKVSQEISLEVIKSMRKVVWKAYELVEIW